MSIINITEELINSYVYGGIVKKASPLKGRVYSDIEISIKFQLNFQKGKKCPVVSTIDNG